MVLRATRVSSVGSKRVKKAVKRSRVLTTDMADKKPARVTKKPIAKKAATPLAARSPARKTIGRKTKAKELPVETPEQPDVIASEPRPARRSAVERLDDPPPADGALLVTRVANAIERELTQIEIIIGNSRVPPRERSEAERRARTLASLARTLSLVTQLREKNVPRPDDDDDTAPRDLDEFRDALSRRLERLVADTAQPVDREPDAD